MNRIRALATALAAAMLVIGAAAHAQDKPTVVLVHGAFAESASWDGVIKKLRADGYPVLAVANPLRGVKSDAQAVSALVDSIPGPVVLVGHSYGGNVISNVTDGRKHVKALVYVAAFAPEAGETVAQLAGKFPGSTLGPALAEAVALANGGKDLYIRRDKFRAQFAADVPAAAAALMAAEQRPIAQAALEEPSGAPAWKQIPSWFVYGVADRNIPPAAVAWMAQRAAARETVAVKGASHLLMVSHPAAVATLIEHAARSAEK
ncbi:MAG TPA: alpha/beta hydrolase [Burkholderiales bacterium]